MSYEELNNLAEKIKPGAEGLKALPFGNGAERMLNNKIIGAHIHNIDFNFHTIAHLARAVQEGIAFSFRYGLDIMRENGMKPQVVRAAKANMFLSNVFSQSFADVNNVEVEYYEGDGSYGAAIGAGIGAGVFSAEEAGKSRKSTGNIQPKDAGLYDELYLQWKHELHKHL
jgi:xylulokinase